MTRRTRWGLVIVLVVALVATPFVVQAWPVPSSRLSAVQVVERIRDARAAGYSGEVTSRGGIEVPGDESISSVAKILGRDGSLRVWWRDPDRWRVATMRTTGETDLFHYPGEAVRWVYESRNVTVLPDAPVRLPTTTDVLPPLLAARVLDDARPSELSRLPTRRVAGHVGVGVRLVPRESQSTIGHVDVWADEESGLPLRVEVYGDQGPAALVTAFTRLDLGRPDREALAFEPPEGSRVRLDRTVDLAAAADLYSDRLAPTRLAGLPTRVRGFGRVGLYGRGPTVLIAVPLRGGDAADLRRQLRTRPGSSCLPEGDALTTGPLSLLLTRRRNADQWLLAGTVEVAALARSVGRLPAGVGDQTAGIPTFTEPCP